MYVLLNPGAIKNNYVIHGSLNESKFIIEIKCNYSHNGAYV